MGLFDRKKKREEKEAQRRAAEAAAAKQAAERAAAAKSAAERTARQRAAAKRAEADQKQEMAITEMRSIKEKIAMWQKKVEFLQSEKKKVLAKMALDKEKNIRFKDEDKKKLADTNRKIKITQGQLETLEAKLTGIEQAAANVSVVDTLATANDVTDKISKPIDEVQDVLQKAEDQRAELEEANLEFMLPSRHDVIDDDELLADLEDFEKEQAYDAAQAAPAHPAPAIPSVPTNKPAVPATVAAAGSPEEDEIEAEMRRMELKNQAAAAV